MVQNNFNPYHVAGKISATGAILNSSGKYPFTVTRGTNQAAGVYRITFTTAHPDGADYPIMLSSQGSVTKICVWEVPGQIPISTSFGIVVFNKDNVLVDCIVHFSVVG